MTPVHHRVLAYIRERVAETGLPPTYSEMSEALGIRRARAFAACKSLLNAGRLTRTQDRWRNMMPADGMPTVVVRWTVEGNTELYVFGTGPVRLLAVDEACPDDRVFEVTTRFPAGDLAKLVPPDGEIGSKDDPRHDALLNRLEAVEQGRRHLRAVK